jgi:hypothetical protein
LQQHQREHQTHLEMQSLWHSCTGVCLLND